MFWTAFIWGLGVSCGASIGFLAMLTAWGFIKVVLPDEGTRRELSEFNRKSVEALIRRNELGEQEVKSLDLIRSVLERMEASK